MTKGRQGNPGQSQESPASATEGRTMARDKVPSSNSCCSQMPLSEPPQGSQEITYIPTHTLSQVTLSYPVTRRHGFTTPCGIFLPSKSAGVSKSTLRSTKRNTFLKSSMPHFSLGETENAKLTEKYSQLIVR